MTEIPEAAIDAAVEALADAALLNNAGYLDGDEQRAAETALRAAAPHMGRPVYVLAVGHDLTDRDAENIQRAVVAALTTTEGGQADGT